MNGSSKSFCAPTWSSAEMWDIVKHFFTVSLVTSSQHTVSILMAFSTFTFGVDLFASIALMICWVIQEWYLAFSDQITPWSIGWGIAVVFGGRKHNSIAFKPTISGWAGQLSNINKTLWFWRLKLFILFTNPIVKQITVHPTFSLPSAVARKVFQIFEASWQL